MNDVMALFILWRSREEFFNATESKELVWE